jgi:predicted dehydrogenase
VRATLFEEKNGVPVDLRGDLIFSDSRTASFHCSFNTTLEQSCRISGTKGALTLDDFVLPCDNEKAAFTIERQEEVGEGSNFSTRSLNREVELTGEAESQKTLLFRNFGKLVLGGERDLYWPEISLLTQRVMDALLESALGDGGMVELD